MKILITGIAGFVGSALARGILQSKSAAQIFGIDNFKYGYRERIKDIKERICFVEGDIENIAQHFSGQKIDIIIHCAAIAPLPECQIDSYRAINQNVAVCGSVVDFALRSGIRNIVFFSSGAVYEGQTIYPSTEDQLISTRLTYPTTKILAERFFESICNAHQINVTAIRLFNLYGPNQDYFRKQPPLIGYLLKCLLLEEQADLYSDGNQRRDYIYIEDLLNLVNTIACKMVDLKKHGQFTVVNACSGKTVSVNEIILEVERLSGRQLNVVRNPPRDYWSKYSEINERAIPLNATIIEDEVNKFTQGSPEKAQNIFNWEAKIEMREGLKYCLDYAIQRFKI